MFVAAGILSLRCLESFNPVLPYGQVFYKLGTEAENKHNAAQALTYYQKAVHYHPAFSDAYTRLGFLYKSRADFVQAQKYFRKALQYNPRDHQALYALGHIFRQRKNYDLALKYTETAYNDYRLDPYVSLYRYELGIIYAELGDKANALVRLKDLRSSGKDQFADQLEKILRQKWPGS